MSSWNLADLFEAVADEIGNHEAVVAGGRRFTFAELDGRANRLAHVLDARGVGPGDRVALSMRNGSEYLEAMLAAMKLRAVPVNVNVRYTVDELHYLLGRRPEGVLPTDLTDRVAAAVDRCPPIRLLAEAPPTNDTCRGARDPPGGRGRSGDDR